MLKSAISVLSIIFCTLGVWAQNLKADISEYDAKLVSYLISKKILIKSDDLLNFKLNQKTNVYSAIMSEISVERSSNATNCGGNGTNGL